ncbi:hypothetical protein MNBD_GAMMA01-1525 [hydrothermal vent metagenome]|uniref:Nitrous oxide reductase maturation protein, outer-membrane lipoprotein NosL n=1 Tax=hydrothermal vent metagenome TaxID=652676 RepID=A0A3B0WCK1_9ZZZZ
MKTVKIILVMLFLVSCSDDAAVVTKPEPIKLSQDAIGYYMQMIVADHAGPKAQLWLDDQNEPIWFVDVRDAILFTRTPEEADNIAIIYAHDMAKNPDYNNVQDVWVDIEQAVFVINSKQKGGMGMPETIPFSSAKSAQEFTKKYGGEVINSITEITTAYLTFQP